METATQNSFKFGDNSIIIVEHRRANNTNHAVIMATHELPKVYLKNEIIDLVALNIGDNPLNNPITERVAFRTAEDSTNEYILKWRN